MIIGKIDGGYDVVKSIDEMKELMVMILKYLID